jgi:hypothetical protein
MRANQLIPFACVLLLSACPASSSPSAATVSREQFKQLEWIAGTWRGSGGAYPAFFEEYRFLNDTTILMRSLADSTLRTATDSSLIEWRGGTIRSGSDRSPSVAFEFSSTSVRFNQPGASTGGHTFTRVSADEWTATLHPAASGGQATVYVMRRIEPAR